MVGELGNTPSGNAAFTSFSKYSLSSSLLRLDEFKEGDVDALDLQEVRARQRLENLVELEPVWRIS